MKHVAWALSAVLLGSLSVGMAVPLAQAAEAPAAQEKPAVILAHSAWGRETISLKRPGVAFVTLQNAQTVAERLVAAEAPEVCERVELHNHEMTDGVMRMVKLEGIDVPAGAKVELKPHGLHLMLMGMKRKVKAGESFPLTLRFASGKTQELSVAVKAWE